MKWRVWNTAKRNVIYHIEAESLDDAIRQGRKYDPDVVAAQPESNEIIVTFKSGRRVKYTKEILSMLKSDPEVSSIIDAGTGEVLFERMKGE